MTPESVAGDPGVRLMQLVLMAAYYPEREWMRLVAHALKELQAAPPSGGIDWVGLFMVYVWETQAPEHVETFQSVWRDVSEGGEELMTTYAQQLRAEGRTEGRSEGRVENQVDVIEGLLREGVEWPVIERATGVSKAQFEQLKAQVDALNE